MLKKIATVLFALLLVTSFSVAQTAKKAPQIFDREVSQSLQKSVPSIGTHSTTATTWVYVDQMANSFGPASATLNPLAYDPYSNTLAICHRGEATYAAGSGEIWWNTSTDNGATWVRSTTSVQSGLTAQIAGRYPSMALINTTNSTTLADVWGAFAWPELGAGAFGWLGYGVSSNLSMSDFAGLIESPPLYSSNTPIWSNHNGDLWSFFTSDNQDDVSLRLFRTQYFLDLEIIDPAAWNDTVFNSGGAIQLGGVSLNGVQYVGVVGTFPDLIAVGGWEPGYSKSTDNGATWSTFSVVDFTAIPALEGCTAMWDYIKGDEYVSYDGDVNVDKNGYVHFVLGFTKDVDTITGYGYNMLAEVFETAAGWDANIIAQGPELVDSCYTQHKDAADSPGLGQIGHGLKIAFDEARENIVVQWGAGSASTNYAHADIYARCRSIDGGFGPVMNLTESDNLNEDGSHLAPFMKKIDGTHVEFYSMYWYQNGVTAPTMDQAGLADIFAAATTIEIPPIVDVEDDVIANSFKLSQNYPNPFNPTTRISFTIPEATNVTLKVYDLLGREVASLINNEVRATGDHNVEFDASNLTSGMYLYKLTAGEFSSTMKMMLLK